MNYLKKLIIIGTSHHNTLSVIRSVGHEGIKPYVILYGHKKSYIESSKYIAGFRQVETAESAADELVIFCKRVSEKPVVIICSDELSMVLDQRYEEICNLCHFFNAGEKGRITHFMDKQVQTTLAKKCGFATPWSIECLPENVPFDIIQYPCIVKPKESVHGGKKIFKCNDNDELKISLREFDARYAVIVQQYIKGEYEVVVIGLTLDGQSIIPGYALKHRDYKGATTYSTIYPATDIPNYIIVPIENMLRHIRYEGLWGMECIKSGEFFYFIELNLRNDATTYSMSVAGVNLPMTYYQAFSSEKNNMILSKKVGVVNSMVEFEDFNFVLKRTVSLRQWKKERKGCGCRYYYDKNDMGPYRAKRKEYFIFLFNRLFHLS